MLQRDEAYVLRTHVLGESDLIVSLFAKEHGKVRGVARAARKSRRRFGGCLEPMTRVQMAWTERPGRELHCIDDVEALRSFAAMQGEPKVQAACAVLSELLEAFTREGQADDTGFRLLGAVLEGLEQSGEVALILRYFEYWLLRIHGLLPPLDACHHCGRSLDRSAAAAAQAGELRCSGCAGSDWAPFGVAEREFLEQAQRSSPSELRVGPRAVRPGGALEGLLRGALEAFAERRFRAYHYLRSISQVGPS